MLRKRDYRIFKGVPAAYLYPAAYDFWSRKGLEVYEVAPLRLAGRSYHTKIGLRRKVEITMTEVEGDTHIELEFRATIGSTGVVGGVVAAAIWLPLAVIGGAASYVKYEDDAKRLISSFWHHLETITDTRSFPTVHPPVAPAPQTIPCTHCGMALPQTWKACPYCGNTQ